VSTTRLEHQQEILVNALRRAQGAPVSYAELRDAGVEFPAAVVAELVLAGVPIERCSKSGSDGRRIVGVRLLGPVADPTPTAPAPDPTPTAPAPVPKTTAPPPVPKTTAPAPHPTLTAPAPGRARGTTSAPSNWHAVRVYRASVGRGLGLAALTSIAALPEESRRATRGARALLRRPGVRLAAPLAVLASLGLVAAVLLLTLTGGASHPRGSVAEMHHARVTAAKGTPRGPSPNTTTITTTATQGTAQPPPTPVSPALATELELRGHSLLEDGRYADAVPLLQTAVRATGESLSACVEPASATCLTYAYALYDLGRALRLSGHPAAAVVILERRLQIDNQRPTVEAELQLARQNIG
jgi:hypothetical protein